MAQPRRKPTLPVWRSGLQPGLIACAALFVCMILVNAAGIVHESAAGGYLTLGAVILALLAFGIVTAASATQILRRVRQVDPDARSIVGIQAAMSCVLWVTGMVLLSVVLIAAIFRLTASL